MEVSPNLSQSNGRLRASAGKKIDFFRHVAAAREAYEQRLNGTLPASKPKPLKPRLPYPRNIRPYEERYRLLFILSSQKRFWAKVNKTNGCWLWTGPQAAHGYGQFSSCDVHILAHRYAFILKSGPVAKGLHLHHTCETPLCVNPSHVQALTPKEHAAAHRALREAACQ